MFSYAEMFHENKGETYKRESMKERYLANLGRATQLQNTYHEFENFNTKTEEIHQNKDNNKITNEESKYKTLHEKMKKNLKTLSNRLEEINNNPAHYKNPVEKIHFLTNCVKILRELIVEIWNTKKYEKYDDMMLSYKLLIAYHQDCMSKYA